MIRQTGFLRALYELLSSKVFLIWGIGCWIIYYVLSAIWLKESFANFAVGLEQSWPVRLPFIIFLASCCLNLIRASKEVLKEGKAAFLLWVVLPFGVVLFMTGFLISISTRQFDWIIAGEGHEILPYWRSESYTAGRISAGLKDRFLDIDADEGKGVFKYEPTMTIIDRSAVAHTVGAFPATRIGNVYFHILNFGLAPGVRLWEGGEKKDEGYMPMKILGAGSSDTFEIPPYPYRFAVTLEPQRVIQKGSLKASEYNLKDPLYSVRVFRGEKIIAEGLSREPLEFDNLAVSFFEPVTWVQLEVVKDYGYPVIVSGIFLIVAGVPLSLIRPLMGVKRKFFRERTGSAAHH